MDLCCPICKSAKFLAFNSRENARCANCHAMERTRLLWLILEEQGLFRPGLRVMHVAPELPLAKRYSELLNERYFACDADAARYTSHFTTIREIDLCRDLAKLPSRCFDLILHSHVLEHVRCDPEGVLAEFERLLVPGGHHFLSVPVSGDATREDMSDDLSDAERSMLFGQHDHMRIFGRRDLPAMLDRVWGTNGRHHIEPLELFDEDILRRAAVPEDAWSGISSHSVFHHRRPLVQTVRIATERATDTPVTHPPPSRRGRPGLILHIGTPKAGTTSLQRWFAAGRDALRAGGIEYWDVAENHSEAMFMAFANPARIARGTMWFQQDREVSIDPEDARRSFDRFLDRLGTRTGFVSAEVLWSFSTHDVKTLAGYLADRGVDALITCWVRPPAEFLTTAVQQRLRSTLSIRDFGVNFREHALIQYSRLEAWRDSFGPENVVILPLQGDIIDQLRTLLAELEITVAVQEDGARALNPSISLLGAKALLALNATPNKGARHLRALLRDIKGEKFRLPESTLKRATPLFRKEARYLADNLHLDAEWLLADATGIDDDAFYKWDYEEVVQLLRALGEALDRSGGRQQ